MDPLLAQLIVAPVYRTINDDTFSEKIEKIKGSESFVSGHEEYLGCSFGDSHVWTYSLVRNDDNIALVSKKYIVFNGIVQVSLKTVEDLD